MATTKTKTLARQPPAGCHRPGLRSFPYGSARLVLTLTLTLSAFHADQGLSDCHLAKLLEMMAYSRGQTKLERMDSERLSFIEKFELQSSTEQRGVAAHIRQEDDNSKQTTISREDRNFLNKVIHDRSLDHRPEFDERLSRIARSRNLPQPSQGGSSVNRRTVDDGTVFVAQAVEGVRGAGVGVDHAKEAHLREREQTLERERRRLERQLESIRFHRDMQQQLHKVLLRPLEQYLRQQQYQRQLGGEVNLSEELKREQRELEQRWYVIVVSVCGGLVALLVCSVVPWPSFISVVILAIKWTIIVLAIMVIVVVEITVILGVAASLLQNMFGRQL